MVERSRNFALITYCSEAMIQSAVTGCDRVRHWAYIKHDKDTNPDGSLKVEHFHVLLNLQNPMSLSAVRKLFPSVNGNGEKVNTLGQAMIDKTECFIYLTHSEEEDESKYIYPETDIKSDDLAYWTSLKERGESDDRTLSIIEDIINRVSFRDLAIRYGRDLVVNYDKYRRYAESVRQEEELFVSKTVVVNSDGEVIEKLNRLESMQESIKDPFE